MRNNVHITLFIGLLLMLPIQLAAANPGSKADNYHFGYISASAGYTSLSQNINNLTTKGNLGYLVGLGYEFRRTSFWLSVGAQYLNEKNQTQINQDIKLEKGVDDQGKNVDYYRWIIQQTDVMTLRTIDVPIMLGYYYNGFYVGAGAKVGFSVGSTISVSGNYELCAKYQHMMEEMHNVNYYKSYTAEEKTYSYAIPPQFSVIGEIGYDLLSTMPTNQNLCHVLKIGFYFEYGVRPIQSKQTVDAIAINGASLAEAREKRYDVRKTTLNPYYTTTETAGKWVVPYYVGVKLTYMIGGNRYATGTWHKGCQCYQ